MEQDEGEEKEQYPWFFDWHLNILHLFAFSQVTFFNDPNSLKF